LVANAVKFTRVGEVYLHLELFGTDEWQFEIIDTGLGIPEEERAEIFQPFHQGSNARHRGGTGLGLAIAQRQVAALGGTLRLQSERGIGSRFYFRIPLPRGEAGLGSATNLLKIQRLKPEFPVSALVIDDSQTNREILAGMLRSVGCEVFVASSGQEGIERCLALKPRIVFLDLLMPGVDGLSVARQILAADRDHLRPTLVAQTAAALARYREEALRAGCCDFLIKPLDAQNVYECLRVHLGVQFEYAAAEPDEDFSGREHISVALPHELYSRIMAASELHSATALKACLQELRQLGPEAQNLSEKIRWLLRSYDMDGIVRLISSAAMPQPLDAALAFNHGID
jgi:CheY-like chemotaxis protein